jgi:DNA-binding transcriptional ArsR family regulator
MSMPFAIAATATLIGDPARATMLAALLDGRALPAGELAYAAGITPQTASAHLAKLLRSGLVECEAQGRHHYYRLAGPQVAAVLEQLASVTDPRRIPEVKSELRFARRCYDHLAGQLGVALTDALLSRDWIRPAAARQFEVSTAGARWFSKMGVDIEALPKHRLGTARQCLDWTERRHHLAGALGVRLLSAMCDLDWMRRSRSSRRILLTAKGALALKIELGIVDVTKSCAQPQLLDPVTSSSAISP